MYLVSKIYRYGFNGDLVLQHELDCIAVFLLSLQVAWTCLMFDEFKATALSRRPSKVLKKASVPVVNKRSVRDPESNYLLVYSAPPPSIV